MKTALIIGLSGGFGGYMARELLKNGWKIKALVRDPEKISIFEGDVEIIQGDAANDSDIRTACHKVDIIVYGVSVPYSDWEKDALRLLEPTARMAEEFALTLVFPGNVYVFNPEDGPEFVETAPIDPIVSKGSIRQKMESRLKRASENGAKLIIFRCGDFIGKHAPSTWLNQLIKANRRGYAVSVTGPKQVLHTWAYLPDLAGTLCQLLENAENLPAFNIFHFKGYQISFEEIALAIKQSGHTQVTLKPFPWWFIRIVSPFSGVFKGLLEMRYLWNQEINLNDSKLRQFLPGPIPHTPLSVALKRSGLVD